MLLIPAAANAGWAVAFLILAGSFLRRSMALAGALAMEMLLSKGMGYAFGFIKTGRRSADRHGRSDSRDGLYEAGYSPPGGLGAAVGGAGDPAPGLPAGTAWRRAGFGSGL
jgi:hypothetical protein